MQLEITIPVLNEEDSLVECVSRALEYLNQSSISDYKIVIADNGSTDRTAALAQELVRTYPQHVSFVKVAQKGVGLALQTTWGASRADIVGYMDLDLATDLRHLEEMYTLFVTNPELAIVNGSRLLPGSKVINRKVIREISSRVFNMLLKALLGAGISDGMCGFKFARREVAQELLATEIHTIGWIFSTEFLVKAQWMRKKIVELPVTWTDDQKSKVKLLPLSWSYFKHLLMLQAEKKAWIQRHV
jgi:glycosyltransferase involved in cell wall biosynthesis